MAALIITHSRKSGAKSEKEIVGVSGAFGYLAKADVHDHIKNKEHTYHTRTTAKEKDGKDVPDAPVYHAGEGVGRYIETRKDNTVKNNLLNLPDV